MVRHRRIDGIQAWKLWSAKNRAAFHDHVHLTQGSDIFCGIAGNSDEIGEKTRRDAAAIIEMENFRVAARRLTQNFQRRKSVFVHEQLHLARVIAVRERRRRRRP